jgi:hypothetical protein
MSSQLRLTDRSINVYSFDYHISMPNLFSFVINMLNQIYNDGQKTEHLPIQLKYNVSKEEKKEKKKRE